MKNDLCHDILLVDDDPDDLMLIREAVNDLSGVFEVRETHNGQQALHYLHKCRNSLPCLIIMDVNMPVMDGRETLRLIKDDADFKKIPVVIFTTTDGKDERAFFHRYGVKMVTKPASFLRLKEVVQKLIQVHSI